VVVEFLVERRVRFADFLIEDVAEGGQRKPLRVF
jgi:hypothetical protein